MRQFVMVVGMVAFGWVTSGCASECEKKCASQYDQAKEMAGGNWGGMEKIAKMGLAACKAACDDG